MVKAGDAREAGRFKVTLDELESVHVPVDRQVTSQSTDPPPGPAPEWDDERRTLRLAGGL